MEAWSFGDAVQACRCGGMDVWSPRTLEVGCRRSDMGIWRYGALEVRCRRSNVEVRHSRVIEKQDNGRILLGYSLRMKGLLPGNLRIKDKRALGLVNVRKKFSIFLRCAQNEFWAFAAYRLP